MSIDTPPITMDTICALATPPGIGGLSVIRVSGSDAFNIADQGFVGKVTCTDALTHTLHYGSWKNNGVLIDHVTVTIFRAPASYTGENVVEIGCHGGKHVVDQLLKSLILFGARPALAGEFTKRAFLNKRLDLTQVEAVADLIHSQSVAGAQTAARQLSGGFTAQLEKISSRLRETTGLLELELDFAEEDVEFVQPDRLLTYIDETTQFVRNALNTSSAAHHLRSGFRVAVVGYPNAGKSALFNALLGRTRAIVSDVPGTTRDYIDESIVLSGFTFRFIDTAGIRQTTDTIELAGIQLGKDILIEADLILVVNDSSLGFNASTELVDQIKELAQDVKTVIVQSKVDLLSPEEYLYAEGLLVSTISEPGITQLMDFLSNEVLIAQNVEMDVLINQRHSMLFEQLLGHLDAAKKGLNNRLSSEYIAVDLKAAMRCISEMTGETWSINVLDDIFSRFCIGK